MYPPTPPPPPPPGRTLPLGEMGGGAAASSRQAAPQRSSALYLDPLDGRPDTALGMTWLSVPALTGGVFFTFAIPSTFALALGLLGLIDTAFELLHVFEQEDVLSEAERLLEEEDIIEARFVRLGVDFDDELPNRVVPVQATALPQLSEVPTENTPSREPIERPEEQDSPNSIEDIMQRLDDRAELFEEIAERREVEGDPDGIEEGTETQAAPGDVYRGRLYAFFRRGWTIPTTVNREEAAAMTATVQIQIGDELQIVSFSIRGSSENPVFDESVNQQLTRLQASDQRIPPPPEEVADQYIGQQIAVRFHGRQAH